MIKGFSENYGNLILFLIVDAIFRKFTVPQTICQLPRTLRQLPQTLRHIPQTSGEPIFPRFSADGAKIFLEIIKNCSIILLIKIRHLPRAFPANVLKKNSLAIPLNLLSGI